MKMTTAAIVTVGKKDRTKTRRMTRHDWDKLTVVHQRDRGGLTSVELWSVVVRRVPQGGQVPTDRYWEHQGHTDPERTYTHTHCQWLLSFPNFTAFQLPYQTNLHHQIPTVTLNIFHFSLQPKSVLNTKLNQHYYFSPQERHLLGNGLLRLLCL